MLALLAGCGESPSERPSREDIIKREAIVKLVNSSGKITDEQTAILSQAKRLSLNGLTSVTDEQAEILSKVKSLYLVGGLTSINDKQAKSMTRLPRNSSPDVPLFPCFSGWVVELQLA
jgi:hypothetical protein